MNLYSSTLYTVSNLVPFWGFNRKENTQNEFRNQSADQESLVRGLGFLIWKCPAPHKTIAHLMVTHQPQMVHWVEMGKGQAQTQRKKFVGI